MLVWGNLKGVDARSLCERINVRNIVFILGQEVQFIPICFIIQNRLNVKDIQLLIHNLANTILL